MLQNNYCLKKDKTAIVLNLKNCSQFFKLKMPTFWSIVWLSLIAKIWAPFVPLNTEQHQQEADMAKAVVISERFFWRNMVERWDCEEMGSPNNKSVEKSAKKLEGICENWKLKALAADAYVKSWKCIQNDGTTTGAQHGTTIAEQNDGTTTGAQHGTTIAEQNDGTTTAGEEMPSTHQQHNDSDDCLCVKPQFRIAAGELLLSSAMVAIMAVYRDLFGWGQGDGLKREILFVNREAWESVDRWLKLYKKAEKMLKIAKNEIEKDEHFEEYKMANLSYESPPLWPDCYAIKRNHNENLEEITIIHNFLTNLDEEFSNFNKMNIIIMGKMNGGHKLNILEDLKKTAEIYEKIWDLSQELGFDMAALCKAGKEFRAKYVEKPMKDTAAASSSVKHKFEQQKIEKELGKKLLLYKEAIHDPMLKKHPDELKPLHDPCEEAELKAKKLVIKKDSDQ